MNKPPSRAHSRDRGSEMEGVDGLVTIDRKWNSGTGHDKFLLSEKKKKNKLAYRE